MRLHEHQQHSKLSHRFAPHLVNALRYARRRSEETPTIMFLQILKSLRRGKLWLDWFEDPAIAEYVSWNVGRKVSLDELIKGGKRLEEVRPHELDILIRLH